MNMPPNTAPLPSPILLLDGGLGTTLKDIYHAPVDGTTRPLWSSHLLISSPSTLTAAQTSFAHAGADIIITATYQASYEGFQHTKHEGASIGEPEAEAYMRSAVQIARAAVENGRAGGKVALSLGAYGATMVPSQEYSGKYDGEHVTVEQLRAWHLRRFSVFAGNETTWREVDFVAFETLPLLEEVAAAREVMYAARRAAPEGWQPRPFWISCVFPGEGLCLPDGSAVEVVVREMLGRKEASDLPFAIGINCTRTGKVRDLVVAFERAVERLVDDGDVDEWPALVLYPDGTKGEVYNTSIHEWEVKTDSTDTVSHVFRPPRALTNSGLVSWDEVMCAIVHEVRNRGKWKSILAGGCCKTSPEDIKKLRIRIDQI